MVLVILMNGMSLQSFADMDQNDWNLQMNLPILTVYDVPDRFWGVSWRLTPCPAFSTTYYNIDKTHGL